MAYNETLRPPTGYIILFAALAASFGLIALPVNAGISAGLALVLAGAAVIIAVATSPRIAVEAATLRAGSAQIGAEFLGGIIALDKEETRAALSADTRAWSLHRSFARGSVRVEIDDPRDPTPYWVVCTNRPEELAEALRAITN